MPVDLTVYHTSDMHNHTAVLDMLHRQSLPEPSLLLDAGDAIRGSNTKFHWSEPILTRMRRSGYRAMTMGNREQHYLRFVQKLRAQERGFPILAANLIDLHNPGHDLWQPSVEFTVAGVRIGIFGATPSQYPLNSRSERLTGLRFEDPWKCLPPLAEELRPRCDLLIFLSHLGVVMDRQVAPALPGVDLILGGHSHSLLPEPEKVGSTWLTHVGCYGRYLGASRVSLNPFHLEYELLDTTAPRCVC